ncbi:hypothetical protein JTB14_003187 [Gonioctena quinquepunctata]|nr:hypothetical protein JTB14_003187 [Gonioctena quinquepunctata]
MKDEGQPLLDIHNLQKTIQRNKSLEQEKEDKENSEYNATGDYQPNEPGKFEGHKILVIGDEYAKKFQQESIISPGDHGGVAVFCKNRFKTETIELCSELSRSNIFECTGIELEVTNIRIIVIYRPPSGNIDIFLQLFETLLDSMTMSDGKIIIGDFNIDFSTENVQTRHIAYLLESNNMTSTIFTPTRVTVTSQTCIDNIIVNNMVTDSA